MKFYVLLFLALPLFALNIIDYKIHSNNANSVNITLSFDGVYEGQIDQKRSKNELLITLNNLNYSKEEVKNINSSLLSKMLISPSKNKTVIMFEAKSEAKIDLSLINDKTGLMIRALPQTAVISSTLPLRQEQEAKIEGFDYTNYIIVILLLFLLLIALWMLNKRLTRRGATSNKDFRIIFQRPLDRHNQFIILEYGLKRFVMIIGNSNIILESIDIKEEQKTPIKKEEKSFESFFEENKQRLQRLIKGKQE